jgi:ribosomal protein S18 acetylase RimI-like enzyme
MRHFIRDAVHADADRIAAFNTAMAFETEHIQLQASTVLAGVRAVLERAELGRYYVVQSGDDVCACLLITYEWSDWRNGIVWWIQSVYVIPAKRQQGIFTAMYDHMRNAATTAGAVGLRLYVERDNTRAQRTYRALGMDETHYRLYEDLF